MRDRSRDYSSESTREDLVTAFKKAFRGLEPGGCWVSEYCTVILSKSNLGASMKNLRIGHGKPWPKAFQSILGLECTISSTLHSKFMKNGSTIKAILIVARPDYSYQGSRVESLCRKATTLEVDSHKLLKLTPDQHVQTVFISMKKWVPSLVWA